MIPPSSIYTADGVTATAPRTSSTHGFITVVRNMNGRMVNMDYEKPTEKQIDYVTSMCEVLGIDLPDEETKEAYSDFIYEHEKEFKQERYKQRYVYSQDTYRLEHSNVMRSGFCGDRKLNMNPQN